MAQLKTPKKGKTGIHALVGRLFCKRSIIIISEHKTQHVPFAVGTQLLGLVAVLVMVGWASYSSGSYMAAQQVLVEKDRKLATTAEENERLDAEFSLLKRDLQKIAEESNGNKLGDYAKLITEQMAQEENSLGHDFAKGLGTEDNSDKYNAVFQRIAFLENKVKELQATHNEMIADIRATTGGRVAALERVIAATGMDKKPLERAVTAKRTQEEQRREKYGRIQNDARGGPFQPVRTSVLKEEETELYFNLKRMMTLNDIVEAMPLENPINGAYRKTSGFGTRIDPFRGALAFHSGVDLAGPNGTRVRATSDGTIGFTGWKNAYGNVVDVNHEFGFTTRYGHLRSILVKPGQRVKKGDVIAIQGSTGRSTGNHVHYEVRYQGKLLNPSNFLKAGENVRALD